MYLYIQQHFSIEAYLALCVLSQCTALQTSCVSGQLTYLGLEEEGDGAWKARQ